MGARIKSKYSCAFILLKVYVDGFNMVISTLKLYVDYFNVVISTLNRLYATGGRDKWGERISQRGSWCTLTLTAIFGAESPGLNFSSNVKDKERLTVALTHHSELAMREGTHLSLLHALIPLLFHWRKNQYLTQRTDLASPERQRFPCGHLKKISPAGPGQELEWLQPAVDFLCTGDHVCSGSIVGVSVLHLPSFPLTPLFLNSVDHFRIHSKSAEGYNVEAQSGGGHPAFLRPAFLSPSHVPFSVNGESGSQTPGRDCSRWGGNLYNLPWVFKALISHRSEKAAWARKQSGT